MVSELEIKDLHVSVEGKKILDGLSLKIRQGETHAIMGPNGSGKTTLSSVVMGHPKYVVESGSILLDGKDVLKLRPDSRAKLGLFLAFQHPLEISGVRVFNFLKTAYTSIHSNGISIEEFEAGIKEKLGKLGMAEVFMDRYLNEGFSGGEKKRFEVLQMLVLKPKIAIMDETDSGLDMDTLKSVSENIKSVSSTTGILLITHYDRILKYIEPQFIHVLIGGKIVRTGGMEIVNLIEKNGYEWFSKNEGG